VTAPSPRTTRPPSSTPADRRQSRYWNSQYRSDPTFFGSGPSRFLGWVLRALGEQGTGSTWVELGAGYGRDLAALERRGYSVRGVDLSRVGAALARQARLDLVATTALRFLSRLRSESVDVVFSNLFYNQEFTEDDHTQLFSQVDRVLAPHGYHAYSVRSVADRWYGKGRRTGPDCFDFAPDGPVLHFFSRPYARRLRRGRFHLVRSWEGTEGKGKFPISVLYFLERKPANVPR